MRFTAVIIAASAIASAAAVPAATPASNSTAAATPAPEDGTIVQWDGVPAHAELVIDPQSSARLEKRALPAVVIGMAGTIGSAALGDLTTRAINAAVGLIGNINNWDSAREQFTRSTTREMWKNNPDPRRWKAAVCYNKDYAVKDRNNVAGFRDAKFSLGPLKTDYDCMYLGAGNAFWTYSDGGYINLSYTHARGACTYDGSTGDLTC